ncbi:MAG: aminotransferase class V-fold PLP-dependent enzyme [Bacteroidota bacterium]|nr:aminotransferase class V-fold PLP-dependent enzyme [Bacteroidota bacterium]
MQDSRNSVIDINPEKFRELGHQLIDQIGDFLAGLNSRAVTTGESPAVLKALLGDRGLPETGESPDKILAGAGELLFNHSLLNGHPKFFGYITSSPAPLGALADLLAAIVNPNVGANILSPMATQIERQTIRWLAELVGVDISYGGILVSGGNMANFTAFLAACKVKGMHLPKDDDSRKRDVTVYCPKTTHTWIEKAVLCFGLSTDALRWIDVNKANQIDTNNLEQTIREDISKNRKPMMVIGTAGDVSTGAVDDLKTLASICKKYGLWFHVDGAYGMPAAAVPSQSHLFEGIREADSIAIDPHKWLYSPLEAGCVLVKDPNHLTETFSSHPVYYNFSVEDGPAGINFYEYGLQNSRGFRALKVWASLQHLGRSGYEKLIEEDIRLSKRMFSLAINHPELEAVTQNLSIATFRYVVPETTGQKMNEEQLNHLNERLLNTIQQKGKAFLSNAVIDGKFCLRACIVNFRTTEKDIEEVIDIVVREGRELLKFSPPQ